MADDRIAQARHAATLVRQRVKPEFGGADKLAWNLAGWVDELADLLAAAEERGKAAGIREGWAQAAAALRDGDAWLAFIANPDHDDALYERENELAADFLDAAASGGGE